jgi:hypothetical protein
MRALHHYKRYGFDRADTIAHLLRMGLEGWASQGLNLSNACIRLPFYIQ